jgi:hypothetical protein
MVNTCFLFAVVSVCCCVAESVPRAVFLTGDFLLVDELNLAGQCCAVTSCLASVHVQYDCCFTVCVSADPSVMSMLAPLLEGAREITIPGTGKRIRAASGFRLFATQNEAKYTSRHPLPLNLRNRFIEIQVGEFPRDELAVIIQNRVDQIPQTLSARYVAPHFQRVKCVDACGNMCFHSVIVAGLKAHS